MGLAVHPLDVVSLQIDQLLKDIVFHGRRSHSIHTARRDHELQSYFDVSIFQQNTFSPGSGRRKLTHNRFLASNTVWENAFVTLEQCASTFLFVTHIDFFSGRREMKVRQLIYNRSSDAAHQSVPIAVVDSHRDTRFRHKIDVMSTGNLCHERATSCRLWRH